MLTIEEVKAMTNEELSAEIAERFTSNLFKDGALDMFTMLSAIIEDEEIAMLVEEFISRGIEAEDIAESITKQSLNDAADRFKEAIFSEADKEKLMALAEDKDEEEPINTLKH